MVNSYTLLLAGHIICAVIWVGGAVTLHGLTRMAMASGDRTRLLQALRDTDTFGLKVHAPLSVALLVMGMLLVNKVGAEFSDVWISLAFLGWIVTFVLGAVVYPKLGREREAIVADQGVESEAFLAQAKKAATVDMAAMTILLLVIVDMAIKPS